MASIKMSEIGNGKSFSLEIWYVQQLLRNWPREHIILYISVSR
jgi:hypothetical protein